MKKEIISVWVSDIGRNKTHQQKFLAGALLFELEVQRG